MSGTDAPARPNLPEYTVSELSQALRRTVEDTYAYVRLRGEVSGFRGQHSSGHCYFSLKDANAKIDAVIWKASYARLRVKPQEGLEMIATGRLTTFPGKSSYQIVVDTLEPAGVGALLALLEERRRKLEAEGLFAPARKKKIPFLPETIGVVTSPTGAVIRDILHRLNDRFPRRVLIWPVPVQGEGAAEKIAAAIRGFNAQEGALRPDVLIVARGGGSIEDLWAFNEEAVVRAAAESTIPLISAVGHETDTTLIDFASDRRAPTPTAAAEMAVPVRAELLAAAAGLGQRLHLGQARYMQDRRTRLASAQRGLPRLEDVLALRSQRFDIAAEKLRGGLAALVQRHALRFHQTAARLRPDGLSQAVVRAQARAVELQVRLQRAIQRRLVDAQRELQRPARLLEAVSYRGTLARGFALVRARDGHVLRSAADVPPGASLTLQFADGAVGAHADPAGGAAPRPKPGKTPGGQGSLF